MDRNHTPNQYYNPNTSPNRNPNTTPPNWFFNPFPMNPFFDSNCYRPHFESSPQQGFYTFAEYGSSQQTYRFAQLSQDKVVPETQPSTDVGPSTQPTQRRKHKKKQVEDTEPIVVAPTRLENGHRRRSLHFQKLGSMCRKTQLLVVTKKDRTSGVKSEIIFSKPWVVGSIVQMI